MENYDFGRKIGQGSYATVYLVRHKITGVVYVAKEMSIENISAKEYEAMETEIRLLAKLQHPGIVQYVESFVAGEPAHTIFVIMGYCEGGDQTRFIKKRSGTSISEKEVLHFLVQLQQALEYLHSENIMHRDLKPGNVFITNGYLQQGDLGIAKELTGTSNMALTCIGTPYYMSPELFQNKPYNHKSDVWALGCLLYELACFKRPFEGQTIAALAQKVMSGSFQALPATFSRNMRLQIKKMLSLTPSSRPELRELLSTGFIRQRVVSYTKSLVSDVDVFPAASLQTLRNQLIRLNITDAATFIPASIQSNYAQKQDTPFEQSYCSPVCDTSFSNEAPEPSAVNVAASKIANPVLPRQASEHVFVSPSRNLSRSSSPVYNNTSSNNDSNGQNSNAAVKKTQARSRSRGHSPNQQQHGNSPQHQQQQQPLQSQQSQQQSQQYSSPPQQQQQSPQQHQQSPSQQHQPPLQQYNSKLYMLPNNSILVASSEDSNASTSNEGNPQVDDHAYTTTKNRYVPKYVTCKAETKEDTSISPEQQPSSGGGEGGAQRSNSLVLLRQRLNTHRRQPESVPVAGLATGNILHSPPDKGKLKGLRRKMSTVALQQQASVSSTPMARGAMRILPVDPQLEPLPPRQETGRARQASVPPQAQPEDAWAQQLQRAAKLLSRDALREAYALLYQQQTGEAFDKQDEDRLLQLLSPHQEELLP